MMTVFVFIAEFIFLWLNRIQHLFGGDSAEYVTVAHTWSIAHPPGYPLYSLFLNLFRVLGLDQSMTLLSSIPTVLTSFVLYKIFLLFNKNKVLVLIPSVLYIFLFPIWLYALVPETFALNNLFIACITYLLLKYSLNKKPVNPWVFFLFGLGLAHHQTILLYLPGWLFFFREQMFAAFKKRSVVFKSIFTFLLGLSPYFYAPIASLFNPPLDYENAKTIDGVIRLITRSTYGTFRSYMGSKPDLLTQVLGLFSSFIYIVMDFRIIGMVLIILGFIFLYKKYRTIFKFSLTVIALELMFFFYINFTLMIAFGAATFERFLISYYFILTFLFGLGFIVLFDLISRMKTKSILLQKIKIIGVYGFGCIFILMIFLSNFRTIRYVRSINYFDIYAQDILNNLPKNAVLATTSDNSTFTVDYYYFVKKYRPDIKLLSVGIFNRSYYQSVLKKRYPELDYTNLSDNNLGLFIQDNSQRYEIFFETPMVPGYWVPYGLVWKYYVDQAAANADSERTIVIDNQIWQNLHIPLLNKNQSNIYHLKALRDDYVGKLYSYARYLFSLRKDALADRYLKIVLRYDINNRNALGLIIWIQSRNKDCRSAKTSLDRFNKNLNITSLEELGSALSYYYYCDKKNPQAGKLLDQYRMINLRSSDQPTQYQFTK